MRVKDKVAIITGAASGLGKAIAQRLAAEGAVALVADINENAAITTARELEGGRAAGYGVDVSRREHVQSFVSKVIADFGRIDILVNNAGITRHAPFLRIDDTTWDAVLGVDLKGVFYCAQAVAPHMIGKRYGKIANISSISGVGASPHATAGSPAGNSAYASAKAGVVQLTKTLARELGPHGVNVNCVAPGFVLTPLTSSTRSPQEVEEHIRARAEAAVLGRPGSPLDIANAVLFLVSDEASFISGQTLCVDGGRTDKM
jgi:NAD(P)-dependent dehydrogenase (short-subunit alcohol dehydrogenase family)